MNNNKYKMTISRLTVDKLGVKLYDRVSAVIAELVANSYDADATEVVISAPMGELLARKESGVLIDQKFIIEVSDNGSGMLVDKAVNEVNDFYLKVGAERRNDLRRGDVSKKYGRRVMGRKGVGKLAPFGVCQTIEVISSSGKQVSDKVSGEKGYITSHFLMDRKLILSETDTPYYPKPGELDETVQPKLGTTIRMRGFDHRRVPKIADFERQMAQRFGLSTPDWRIVLRDSNKKPGDDDYERVVGAFETQLKPGTKIIFKRKASAKEDSCEVKDYEVRGPEGISVGDIVAGFALEKKFYPVTGWIGYAKDPYKDDLMAGVRVYCRGKIAAQTAVFNMKAGFTGEHDVRSYLIGELHADWLDEDDDLIRTDRQDILWSHDLGQAFQAWGQSLVKLVGKITREPMRKSAWETFRQVSRIDERVADAYPGEQQHEIRFRTLEMAETIAKTVRGDELLDDQTVESFVQLSLLLGPHITLDRKLKEAAESKDRPLDVITEVLKTARLAELASFGRIADDRIRVIDRLGILKGATNTDESDFQELLTEAPWLINPQWSPITSNQTFSTLKKELITFHEKRTGQTLVLEPFKKPQKRADFVLSSEDNALRIVEIKNPGHELKNEEMDRIITYHDLMTDFLNENPEFSKYYPRFEITLVCDELGLSGAQKTSLASYQKEKILEHLKWNAFLLRATRTHQAFLDEAERQRKIATKKN